VSRTGICVRRRHGLEAGVGASTCLSEGWMGLLSSHLTAVYSICIKGVHLSNCSKSRRCVHQSQWWGCKRTYMYSRRAFGLFGESELLSFHDCCV